MAKRGLISLLISYILADELTLAPERVQKVVTELPQDSLEVVQENEESRGLRDKYLEAGVIGITHANDAHHVGHCNSIGCRYDRKLELQTYCSL